MEFKDPYNCVFLCLGGSLRDDLNVGSTEQKEGIWLTGVVYVEAIRNQSTEFFFIIA